jgi:hypothetical protein
MSQHQCLKRLSHSASANPSRTRYFDTSHSKAGSHHSFDRTNAIAGIVAVAALLPRQQAHDLRCIPRATACRWYAALIQPCCNGPQRCCALVTHFLAAPFLAARAKNESKAR